MWNDTEIKVILSDQQMRNKNTNFDMPLVHVTNSVGLANIIYNSYTSKGSISDGNHPSSWWISIIFSDGVY